MSAKHFLKTIIGPAIALMTSLGCAQAAELTHGPMIGHTTDTTARIWVRTDGPGRVQVRAVSAAGKATTSEVIRLVEEDNFCGSIELKGLSAATIYRYRILLNGGELSPSLNQEFTTLPSEQHRGMVRVGFGHSVRGPGQQTTWRSIAKKKPDLFILMGDNVYSNTTEPTKHRRMYLEQRADPHFAAFAATLREKNLALAELGSYKLLDEELLCARLYTGPMYRKYAAVLRAAYLRYMGPV